MTVRLRFVREDDPISSAIAWFSHGPCSHVGAIMEGGSELGARNDRVGGKPPGVQIRPGDYAKFAYSETFIVPATAEQEKAFWGFLFAQVGKPYDRLAILGFVSGRNWRQDDAWFCAEIDARALEISKLVPPLYLIDNKITPAALALVVSAIGGKRELCLSGC